MLTDVDQHILLGEGVEVTSGSVNSAAVTIENAGVSETYGDINGDNSIDVFDSLLVQKYVVDKIELSDEQVALADVNADGTVDVLDATDIQKFAVDKITQFQKR